MCGEMVNLSISFNGHPLDTASQSFHYLGIVINKNLTWNNHIDYLKSTINRKLGLLRRIKSYLLGARITFFNSYNRHNLGG